MSCSKVPFVLALLFLVAVATLQADARSTRRSRGRSSPRCRSSRDCRGRRPVCHFSRARRLGHCRPCRRSSECPSARPVCKRDGRCQYCQFNNDAPCTMRMARDVMKRCNAALKKLYVSGKRCSVAEFSKLLLEPRHKMYSTCKCLCKNRDKDGKKIFVNNQEQCHFRFFFAGRRSLESFATSVLKASRFLVVQGQSVHRRCSLQVQDSETRN